MPTWSYRVEFYLDNAATRHHPQRCLVLPSTFGTELEASMAARRAFSQVSKQYGRVLAQVMIDELCVDSIPGVRRV